MDGAQPEEAPEARGRLIPARAARQALAGRFSRAWLARQALAARFSRAWLVRQALAAQEQPELLNSSPLSKTAGP